MLNTGCGDVLCPCVRNAGRVSVRVEFVIRSTTQNQLERENEMEKGIILGSLTKNERL